ncbi:MAG: flagellar basal body-associated FliL family protein [Rhodospirillales bacterium]|nr:flagellar basal body-associated FliL family protein [Rhodospirillales bacterium]
MAKKAKAVMPPADSAEGGEGAASPGRGGRRRILMLAVPVVLAAAGGGLWFSGILPHLLGMGAKPRTKVASGPAKPIFVDLPEMVANLDGDPRRPSYVKLLARLEVRNAKDAARVKDTMPRLEDLFQTYLRDMRPSELRGSEGTYRLREELLARADVAAAPARIVDVLFTQLLIQ